MTSTGSPRTDTRVLILASLSGGYAGANAVGQLHADYPANTYIFPCLSPCMFPEQFYIDAFHRGIDGILVMYSGSDCPYTGAPEHTAKTINKVYTRMNEEGIDTRRLKLTAICTVCTKPFLKNVNQMHTLLEEIGTVDTEIKGGIKAASGGEA
ncbi:MAG: hydrogenase iron-sulfur subunit [Anaerolineales bacterium]|nr:hydrogenase iron-sulfur subunit [Anaerolineales bacterium]